MWILALHGNLSSFTFRLNTYSLSGQQEQGREEKEIRTSRDSVGTDLRRDRSNPNKVIVGEKLFVEAEENFVSFTCNALFHQGYHLLLSRPSCWDHMPSSPTAILALLPSMVCPCSLVSALHPPLLSPVVPPMLRLRLLPMKVGEVEGRDARKLAEGLGAAPVPADLTGHTAVGVLEREEATLVVAADEVVMQPEVERNAILTVVAVPDASYSAHHLLRDDRDSKERRDEKVGAAGEREEEGGRKAGGGAGYQQSRGGKGVEQRWRGGVGAHG
eukprot:766976-Hanusia_phi.AAC.2